MNRNFKLALAVSLATHVVAFALVRVALSGEGVAGRELAELPVVLIVSVPEDFVTPRPETPPAPVAPSPKPEPVPAPAPSSAVETPPPVAVMKPERTAEPLPFTPPAETKFTEPSLVSRPSPAVGTSLTNQVIPVVVAVAVSPPAPATAPAWITGRVKYRRAPDPEYPLLARRRKQEGTVLLEVLIAPDGRASGVTLKKSSGFPALDRAALEAVPGWEFEVSTAQPVRAEIPVRFELVK